MTARPDHRQFDMFAEPTAAARTAQVIATADRREPETADEAIIRVLIDEGEADWYSVSLGYHPRDPHHTERSAPWCAPSRLFQFPYRFWRRTGEDTAIAIKHPLLSDHPHVAMLAKRTGFPVTIDTGHGGDGTWQHAVDLCTDESWQTLLALQHFTTDRAIAGGVAFAVRYRALSLRNARAVLAAISRPEPDDRSASILATVRRDEHLDEKGRTTRPINLFPADRDNLPIGWEPWLLIHGREDKVFVFRGDHLEWNRNESGRP